MVPRRVYLNLGAFVVLFGVLAYWAAANVIKLDSLQDTYRLTAHFTDATGLRPGVEVTFRGIPVGKVRKVSLAGGDAVAELAIDADRPIPRGAGAAIRRRSAVGEPYLAIQVPEGWAAGDEVASDGEEIPVERTSAALAYGELFDNADEVLSAIDRDDLRTVVDELATGLDGRGDELRRVITGTSQAAATFAAGADDLDALAVELTALTGVLADKSGTIAEGADDLTTLVESLSARTADIEALLDRSPPLAQQVGAILEASYFSVRCGLDSAGIIAAAIGDEATIGQITRLLRAADTAAEVIPKAVYEGPDGRYLSGTFGFAPGQLVEYNEFPTFEDPRDVPPCPQGTPPVPEGLRDSAPVASGAAGGTGDRDRAGDAAAPPELAEPSGTAGPEDGGGGWPWWPAAVLTAVAALAAGAAMWRRRRS